MFRKLSITLLITAAALLSACATMQQPVERDAQSAMAEIETGDWVEIVKHDGEEVHFWVTEVSDTGIAGAEGVRRQGRQHDIAYSDMSVLTVKRTDRETTAMGWAAGLILLPVLAPALISAPALPLGTL